MRSPVQIWLAAPLETLEPQRFEGFLFFTGTHKKRLLGFIWGLLHKKRGYNCPVLDGCTRFSYVPVLFNLNAVTASAAAASAD